MRRVFVLVLASIFLSSSWATNTRAVQTAAVNNSKAANGSKATNGSKANGGSESAVTAFPVKEGSVRFAVIGDTGTGSKAQRQLAELMLRSRKTFPFEFVLMMGDNMYGGEDAKDFANKFEEPYKELLASGVTFYATLGNHDTSNQRFYKHFNMGGKEYYTFKKSNVRFFSLNSDYIDPQQLKWLEEELKNSKAEWKLCFFHHPLYSSGKKHGPHEELRRVLEPLFVKHEVALVLSGHEHFYERFKPQQGIYYFISGAGGKLRRGGINKTDLTAKSYDDDLHFMLVEIVGNSMYFQVISRTGATVDQGVLTHPRRGSEVAAQ